MLRPHLRMRCSAGGFGWGRGRGRRERVFEGASIGEETEEALQGVRIGGLGRKGSGCL